MSKIIFTVMICCFAFQAQAQKSFAVLDNCDNTTGWKTGAEAGSYQVTLYTGDQVQEGLGCLETTRDTTEQKFYKIFETPVDLTNGGAIDVNDAVLSFWLYVSDASVITGRGQIELSSSGGADEEEWSWYIGPGEREIKTGWNEFEIPLSTHLSYGGDANMTRINWFRIYFFTKPGESGKSEEETRSVVYRLDDIRITNNSFVNVANFAVSKDAQGVKISWDVINSSSDCQFMIEHSTNNSDFNSLTIIDEVQGSLPKKYEYIDTRNNLSGTNYYRLKYITSKTIETLGTDFVILTVDQRGIIGKVIGGYQGWFGVPGDGFGNWRHWASGTPSKGNETFEVYPNISEYEESALGQTAYADFGDGRKAKLFSSLGSNVIDTHMKWMKDYEIDGAALQRFMGQTTNTSTRATVDSVAVRMARAAEKHDRIFYIMWDMSTTDETRLQTDWNHLVNDLKITDYSSYAHQDGKPVVCIWGFGFDHRGSNTAAAVRMINWLKQEKGCYVIGGIPVNWRTTTTPGFTLSDFEAVYKAFDMISPWATGNLRMNSLASHLTNRLKPDLDYCQANGLAYQPVAFPGFAWSQWQDHSADPVNDFPRLAGEFAWAQLKNIRSIGTPNLYLAMFDEYDEGTAWMKNASDFTEIPTDQYFLTASADGYWLSSDFQLRVAKQMSRVMKGTEELTEKMPVPHSLGPVYYRNSFEKRASSMTQTGTYNIDPCFMNPRLYSQQATTGSGQAVTLVENNPSAAKSGTCYARFTRTASANASCYYLFAETKIKVEDGMTLTFWKYAVNERGLNTSVSLQFDGISNSNNSGTYLHTMSLTDKEGIGVSPINARGTIGAWTKHEIVIGQGDLIGKTITGILLGYNRSVSGSGTSAFDAYFDDILIADGEPLNSVVGKVIAGYQGWFNFTGDGTPLNWRHWFAGDSPNPNGISFEVYPDISEYNESDLATPTQLDNFGDGRPAKLFSAYKENVIETHMKWMKDYEIDGAALQRFMSYTQDNRRGPSDSIAVRMARAAVKYDRIFYIMWDMGASNTDVERMKTDWTHLVNDLKLTDYSSYARQNGKPVVCIWGVGLNSRTNSPTNSMTMINWLKSQGCYVIGGVPADWRTCSGDSHPGYEDVYKALDMVMPWWVGRIRMNSITSNETSRLIPDLAYCKANGMEYQPVTYPGFAWSQWKAGTNNAVNDYPRSEGRFAWEQFQRINKAGIKNLYLAMFDEYDEGTAWMKNASDFTEIPTNQYFLTASADGYWLSSDFQLRVARQISRVMKGNESFTTDLSVPHSLGPVYYRNSFEKRESTLSKPGLFNLDPCFFNAAQVSRTNVSDQSTTNVENPLARSGKYLARITGTASANGSYYYKIGDAKIAIKENMTLTFWKYAVNERGLYTSMSLRLDDGTLLHNMTALTDVAGLGVKPSNARGEIGAWTKHEIIIGRGDLIGKTISGILLGYESTNAGSFDAYFDDILIADGEQSGGGTVSIIPTVREKSAVNIYPTVVEDGLITIDAMQAEDSGLLVVSLVNVQGTTVYKGTIYPKTVKKLSVNLPQGIYVVLVNGSKTNAMKKVIIK
jgi:hypothetical protein